MKTKLFLFSIIALALSFTSCQNSNANAVFYSQSKDTTVVGTIVKMWWLAGQGSSSGGIRLNDGTELSIASDYKGENGAGRIFISPDEVKDILFLDKDKARDKLNTKYLDKNVKATYKNNGGTVITNLELTGGEAAISNQPKTMTGFITGFIENKKGGQFLVFQNDDKTTDTLRIYVDPNNHYTVTSIYNGSGNKSDYVFCTKFYTLALTPGNTQKKVKITCDRKLVSEVDISNGTKTYVFNDNVVMEVQWAGKK